MPANQKNALRFNPGSLDLTLVAEYQRTIPAPSERVWENVLDWEHLPWLHQSSFDYIELDEAGDWGWRTWSTPEHSAHIELSRAADDRYVARSYEAGRQISEIWTTVTPSGNDTRITVEFYFPDVEASRSDSLRASILALYTQLWDEDEAMMVERHRRLLEERNEHKEVNLGNANTLNDKLSAGDPIVFQLGRREYRLRNADAGLYAHATICPHLSGPLDQASEENNQLSCPWHGYRFDIQTGECVYPESAACRLPPAPTIILTDGNIIARSNA